MTPRIRTACRRLGMIKRRDQSEIIGRGMTQLTGVHTDGMGCPLAGGDGVVVAIHTTVGSLTVIKGH